MKVQEVIMRAMAKRISWLDAAEILGWSPRTLRRWRAWYRIRGYDGLFDRRKRRPSPRRVPMETVEKVLGLYRERYEGWNGRHFHEKLREEHGIELSYFGSSVRCRRLDCWASGSGGGFIGWSESGGRCGGCFCLWTGALMIGFRGWDGSRI
ncbi:helix-turn-helix domain-containing protein [Verrucomicrobium sp. 3C]|uniref:helix-turn-helix domain-containing protein n=1 Tax=Verrucomicrobium sp. 3C TaxID=1134055 RepID=UPI001E5DC5A8|nr:helix-turn-helix domain-containing protein [Verrucomicrobium sp. 3C]